MDMSQENGNGKNGSTDLPSPLETEEVLRDRITLLKGRVAELETELESRPSPASPSGSPPALELPAGASRDELIGFIFKLQMRIFELQEQARGDCGKCGKK